MAERPITIISVCETKPEQQVHVKAGDKVRWHADHAEIFVLHIIGEFFEGEPYDFPILVVSGVWTKDYVVAGKSGSKLVNYIYDLSGKNCTSPKLAGPPDIIIDATLGLPKKPRPPKKKAAAKRKK